MTISRRWAAPFAALAGVAILTLSGCTGSTPTAQPLVSAPAGSDTAAAAAPGTAPTTAPAPSSTAAPVSRAVITSTTRWMPRQECRCSTRWS